MFKIAFLPPQKAKIVSAWPNHGGPRLAPRCARRRLNTHGGLHWRWDLNERRHRRLSWAARLVASQRRSAPLGACRRRTFASYSRGTTTSRASCSRRRSAWTRPRAVLRARRWATHPRSAQRRRRRRRAKRHFELELHFGSAEGASFSDGADSSEDVSAIREGAAAAAAAAERCAPPHWRVRRLVSCVVSPRARRAKRKSTVASTRSTARRKRLAAL